MPWYDKLKADFPDLYGPELPIECGPGWEKLLRELSTDVLPLWKHLPHSATETPTIFCVKEKFGGLRWCYELVRDYDHDLYEDVNVYAIESTIDHLIELAFKKAMVTCEACGKPGLMYTDPVTLNMPWYRVRCADHVSTPQVRRSGWDTVAAPL